jgi:16S rRNA (adenine1518-N6/adenine1519-N6)-dimethyltransferase
LNHTPRKRFGQNFLVDSSVIQRISNTVQAGEDQLLIEIGPGRAAMTEALLESAADVIAVEIDRNLAAGLRQKFASRPNIKIVEADALDTDFGDLAAGRPYRLLGNLPYNISTPLIFHILSQQQAPMDMHFMLQAEVVKRLAADPGNKRYGRLTVMVQNLCQVSPLFDVPPTAFDPQPKVDSGFVRLVPRPKPLCGAGLEASLDRIVRQAFSLRRKTLRNSLSPLLDAGQIEACGIDPGSRAEQLSLEQFFELARALDSK